MKLKDKIITIAITGIAICIYVLISSYHTMNANIKRVYNVYLNGEMIGIIDNKDQLYKLIDQDQNAIKEKYNVSSVYPPNSLQVLENYSYNAKVDSIDYIYNKIQELDSFTISGYEVKFSKTESHDAFSVNVLKKEVLEDALHEFVLAFVSEEDYNNYMNGTQKELDGEGIIYRDMKLLEEISIKEKYLATNKKIYDNSEELAQELLFGFNYKEKTYTVKVGDTIESISAANTLNTQEFLIANPRYTSKDSLLVVGDKVNITLIDPEITFAYTVSEVKREEYDFDKLVERDNSKDSSYSEITTPGVKGVSIITSHYDVINGEMNSEVVIDNNEEIIKKVDQITTKGKQVYSSFWSSYEDTGSGWRWPTESPYYVSSEFEPRWGSFHYGIDISGRLLGTNIYAANDGVVVKVNTGCPNVGSLYNNCGGGYGNYVLISHGNDIYTIYAHMWSNIPVRVGQELARGSVVGYMGSSGKSTGTHLHFGLAIGNPFEGGKWQNPRRLWR